jgi:hypothetical protein
MSVFVITVALQVIIMFYGNVVFSIPPGSLTGGGWAASVCLPLGTFVIGFLVRLLPSREWRDISSRFAEAEKSIEESIIDVSSLPLEGDKVEAPQEHEQGRSEGMSITITYKSAPANPVDTTVEMSATGSSRAHTNWKRAIEKTQLQIKVIRAFQVPAASRSSMSSINSSHIVYRDSSGPVRRQSSFVSTIRGGRTHASDYISLQVLDANEARDKAHGRE